MMTAQTNRLLTKYAGWLLALCMCHMSTGMQARYPIVLQVLLLSKQPARGTASSKQPARGTASVKQFLLQVLPHRPCAEQETCRVSW